MTFSSITGWAEKNPLIAGVAVFGVGLVVLYFLGYFGGGSAQGDPSTQAYYSAVAADAQAGDALQAAQIAANASTAQTLIAASANVQNNTTWANNSLAITQTNDQAAMSLAPFQQNEDLIAALTDVATLPGTQSTVVKHSSGFFGIGGGNKVSTVTIPNPNAILAGESLTQFVNGLYPSH